MRFIFPTLLVLAAIGLFVIYTNPQYAAVSTLQTQQAAYDQALTNSKKLLALRDTLTAQYNALTPDDLSRLQTLMPDSVDNIHLVLDIQGIANKYGMNVSDIDFGDDSSESSTATQSTTDQNTIYGTYDMGFSVTGTYQNFLSFLGDLEQSLRIIDVESIAFDTTAATGASYKYTLKVQTYWLKQTSS